MILLNRGYKKPFIILISILFVPVICACLAAVLLEYRISLLIAFFIAVGIYALFVFAAQKISASKKAYLEICDNGIIVKYPNVPKYVEDTTIAYDCIVKFEYYKLSSVISWMQMFCYVSPQCVYLTILNNGREECMLIGYPDRYELQKLCREKNLVFIEK